MRYSPLIIALGICCFAPFAFSESVIRVIDGDSLVISPNREIRLYGIDAPEYDQPYGKVAQLYLEKLLTDNEFSIEKCFPHKDTRNVCILTINSEGRSADIGEVMVKAGYAHDYFKYSRGKYLQIEREAKANHRGMWKEDVVNIKPWKHRHSSTQPH